MSDKIQFNFKETEPPSDTFMRRATHMLTVTNPKLFFVPDEEIVAGVKVVKHFKALAKASEGGNIQITQEEKEKILRGIELMNACTNDQGELVLKPLRMCGFVPINVPILCGMFLSPPTMFYTGLWQWINQSYNAGLNFGNKNSTCEYSTTDLLMGYGAASFSSIGMGLGLRKLTSGLTKGASGKKLFFLNFIVGAGASGTANFFNTMCMRYVEISKGITVYKDAETS